MDNPIDQFREAMASRGIVPPSDIIADGIIHRCDAEGRRGKSDATYLLHLDGIPAGGFQNWRDGGGWQNWHAEMGRALTDNEKTAYRAKVANMQRARQTEDQLRKAEASEKAKKIWAESSECHEHGYLTRKGIKANGAKLYKGSLVLPIRDMEGVLHSLQFIDANGEKRFLTGGRKQGNHFVIGEVGEVMCICEGFATGASIYEATGHAVAVAFDAGNLLPVAKALRQKFPELKLILCADDDYRTDGNPGKTKAIEAAKAVNGLVAMPEFANRPEKATDFNDLHQAQGVEAVKRIIEKASRTRLPNTPPPKSELVATEDELERAKLTRRCIVENYLYADVATLCAAGGVGKTTLAIREAVHIILGRPLWGCKVVTPGWVLFVSAEDTREIFLARLREAIDVMELDEFERKKVIDDFIVWEVVGEQVKLTESHDGNLEPTSLADNIVSTYRDAPPILVNFDPLVSFGVDEERVNTNEQAIINAARKIMRGLDCCVRLIHHTGKANAREGALDQYAGRGGSALADGSRMVAVLQPWSTSEPGKLTPPPQLNNPKTAVILSRAKGTYCRPQPLIWIVRDGFQFEYAVNQPISAIENRRAQVDQLERYLFSQTNDNRRHTRKTLDDAYDGIGLTRVHGRGALTELLVSCRVVEVALQKKEKQGGKRTFLCPADLAASFSEVEGKTEVAGDYLADPSTSPPPYRELNGGEVAAPL